MPNWKEIEIKDAFKERYSKLTDWESFRKTSLTFLRRSIRINTLEIDIKNLKKRIENKGWKLEQIPWCEYGFWISNPKRRDVGNLLEHNLGMFYTQEAVSMIPPIVLGAKAGEKILDIAASPGSKTTQISQMMKNKGIIIANDYKNVRMAPLVTNIQRMGCVNVMTTVSYGQRIKNYSFDRVLVDAPCSGTGTIRKSVKTLKIWNPGMIKRLAQQQKKLIVAGYDNLKKGGVMVYSTCSLEPEENEAVVDYLLKERKAQVEEIKEKELPGLKRGKAVLEWEGQKFDNNISKAIRIWPQDNDTEGFFICRIRKGN